MSARRRAAQEISLIELAGNVNSILDSMPGIDTPNNRKANWYTANRNDLELVLMNIGRIVKEGAKNET